jgi:hypothetical protein
MALAVSLGTLITSAQRRAGMDEGATSTAAAVSQAEWIDYANEGWFELYDLLIAARCENYYRSEETIVVASNVGDYPLPSDFYQALSVDVFLALGSSSPKIGARPYNENDRNRFLAYPGAVIGWGTGPVWYQLQGGNIDIIPVPSGTYSIQLNYVPVAPTLANLVDTIDSVNGWHNYVIWQMVATALAKLSLDPSYAMSRVAQLKTKLEKLAADRTINMNHRMRDTRLEDMNLYGGFWGGNNY